MKIYGTEMYGVLLIEPDVFNDNRGSFKETWNWTSQIFNYPVVQDNESVSIKGVARGLHWQANPMPQAKLVRCVKGKIFDIVLCLIKNSPDFGNYYMYELSEENNKQIYIPRGYAHGFIAIGSENIVDYKVDNFWNPSLERCLDIRQLNFDSSNQYGVQNENLIISEKDKQGILFNDLKSEDLFEYNEYELNLVLQQKGIDPEEFSKTLEERYSQMQ